MLKKLTRNDVKVKEKGVKVLGMSLSKIDIKRQIKSHHRLLCLDGLDLQTFILFWGSMVVLPLVCIPTQGQLPWWPALAIGPRLPWLGRRARVISTLFLGYMCLRPMHSLHMLTQGAWVCVAFGAAWNFTYIWFLKIKGKGRAVRNMLPGNTIFEQHNCLSVPHLSVCDSDVSPDLRHWKRPCCSLRAHTHKVSLRCGNASES